MTPQAFSYPTVGKDGIIYVPPYGLQEELDCMIAINPVTYAFKKIPLTTNSTLEKYTFGILVDDEIFWLPYGESRVLVYDTKYETSSYIDIKWPKGLESVKGKFVQGHVYKNKIYALPYGESEPLDYILIVDLVTYTAELVYIAVANTDCKKWHQSVIRDGVIYAVPRGERSDNPFNYAIEFNCDTLGFKLTNFSSLYPGFEDSRMKYTTIALANDIIYAVPYGYENEFDFLLKNKNGTWTSERTGIVETTRKYFTHIKTANNKLYFPPAGHHVEWSKFLIIDGNTEQYKTIDIGVGSETKKYFAGIENSQGKVYYIPRGGCICDPDANLKLTGDLAEMLVVDTNDDSHYTIDISQCFTDNTTIEKYNACCIVNDVIFAMPYGDSKSFQTVLVFDTKTETIIKTLDLNELSIV